MEHYIPKSTLVAEIERRRDYYKRNPLLINAEYCIDEDNAILEFIDTLEVKEVGIDIPNIDDLFEEDGINPYSKDVKLFKECYYTALEMYKEKKGIV